MAPWLLSSALLGLLGFFALPPRTWLGYVGEGRDWSDSGSTSSSFSDIWSKIIPSRQLAYQPCYGELQCARLEVPMDWMGEANNDVGSTVAIAMVRRPAKVSVIDPRYGGAILVNPGGPGASGVQQVVRQGEMLQDIFDSGDSSGLLFDVIGFDPRSIGYTMPKLECFPDYTSRQYWALQSSSGGALGSKNVSFASRLSRWQALGKSCVNRAINHNASIAFHMNSAAVVEDMVAIIESHGEWREAMARSSVAQPRFDLLRRLLRTKTTSSYDMAAVERAKWTVGREKLLYYGLSYGTVLGQLFAHLHPDRVSRMLLDSVVDTDNYLGAKWSGNLSQSNDVLDYFFDSCSNSSACSFGKGDSASTRDQFTSLLDSLDHRPLPVSSTPDISADIITSSDVKRLAREALYCPMQKFPHLDRVLTDLI